MKHGWLAAIALVLVPACREERSGEALGVEGDRPPPATGTEPAAPADRAATARLLAAAQVLAEGEIAASRLAQQKAASPQVKDFAGKMITEHQQDLDAIQRLAQRGGYDVNGAREKEPLIRADISAHRDGMSELTALSGAAFDARYLGDVPHSHLHMAKIGEEGGRVTGDAEVGRFFAALAAKARAHRDHATAMLPSACGGAAPGTPAPATPPPR